jgi:dUTP pyrophosphatase
MLPVGSDDGGWPRSLYCPAMLPVPLQQLDPELPTPPSARAGDAGADLVARADVVLPRRGGRAVIPTGVAVAIPTGFAGLVLPRSGLAARHGLTCLNAPGLIDAGYRGELQVILVNHDPELDYTVRRGDRIAQLVIIRVEQAAFALAGEGGLEETQRGSGGFGHTGT